MYIECKTDGLTGPARIGRVSFSQTGRTIYYGGRKLAASVGFKSNHVDVKTGQEFWISGCKKSGQDTLYAGIVEIDEDVREEYWVKIRGLPQNKNQRVCRSNGKYAK